MGCDIHMVLERKIGDEWVGWRNYTSFDTTALDITASDPNIRGEKIEIYPFVPWKIRCRNYRLFADLAGVRGDGPDPRGLPPDISAMTKFEVDGWGGDGHSHSWGLLTEIGAIFLAYYCPEAVLEDSRRRTVSDLFGIDNYDDLDQYRLVYWFDN